MKREFSIASCRPHIRLQRKSVYVVSMSVPCSAIGATKKKRKRQTPEEKEKDIASKGGLTEEVKAFFAFEVSLRGGKKKRRSVTEIKRLVDSRSVEEEKELSPRTKWRDEWCYYYTQVKLCGKVYHIISFSFESAKEADKLANAAADSLNSLSAQNTNKKTKIENLASKRRRDVSVSGDNSNMERRVALKIVEAWEEKTGHPAFVLNDGTKADILLGFGEGSFLPLQLKTTKAPVKKTYYYFAHVCGYSGMPVVCWRCDSNKAWIVDGTALDERAKSKICFSPSGGRNREMALAKDVDMEGLVSFLQASKNAPSSLWKTTTEDEARCDFQSESHKKEYNGILAYCSLFPDRSFTWPAGQNSHVDLLDGSKRLQFKTVRKNKGSSGFLCHMTTNGGRDEDGKQITIPYPTGSFDMLVAVYFDSDSKAHFWEIPALDLEQQGILGTKTGFRVFAPKDVPIETRSVSEDKCKHLWTRKRYLHQPRTT